MDLGVAETCNGVEMIRRRVAFVAIEAVSRIAGMQLPHLVVTDHFRDDGRGGNLQPPLHVKRPVRLAPSPIRPSVNVAVGIWLRL